MKTETELMKYEILSFMCNSIWELTKCP